MYIIIFKAVQNKPSTLAARSFLSLLGEKRRKLKKNILIILQRKKKSKSDRKSYKNDTELQIELENNKH
jgi:hypothetical protein